MFIEKSVLNFESLERHFLPYTSDMQSIFLHRFTFEYFGEAGTVRGVERHGSAIRFRKKSLSTAFGICALKFTYTTLNTESEKRARLRVHCI